MRIKKNMQCNKDTDDAVLKKGALILHKIILFSDPMTQQKTINFNPAFVHARF